jgi:putative redox protein
MSNDISILYTGELRCEVSGDDPDRLVHTDAPADKGGKGQMFSPTDLLAAALGTCVLTTMGMVAQRNGIDITGTRVRVAKEMTSTPTRRVGKFALQIAFPPDKPLAAQERARIEAAVRRCPVKESLHPDIAIEYLFA